MVVGIDKAGKEATTSEVNDSSFGTDTRGDLSISADGRDAAFVYSNGLCPGVTGI
jgi:hypothetical protein